MVPFRVANLARLRPDTEYRKNHKYYELPAALDVETSKTGNDPDKDFAFVYLWALAVGEFVIYGRTPEDLAEFLPVLQSELRLTVDFRLLVFVHFLKYDFSFLKKYLQIESENFIARSKHEPLRVQVNGCIELRDSYTYTEQPLEKIGMEVGLRKVEGYDYDAIRTPYTEPTADELRYQETDVLILTRYFTYQANFYGGLSNLPITATQRVTRVISAELMRFSEKIKWRIHGQQLDPRKEEDKLTLHLLHIAFFGGFNFCNRLQAGTVHKQVYGVDIDTSYGAQCLFHRFPRSKFRPLPTMPDGSVPDEMLRDIIEGRGVFRNKALLITFEVEDLQARIPELAFLPIYCKNYIQRGLDTKRSMKSNHLSDCPHVVTCLTDVDFRLMHEWYTWKPGSLKIHSILGSTYEPLPEYVQNAIMQMIEQKKLTKSELKAVQQHRRITEEENAEYHRIKSFVSRIYGVFVQDPLRIQYTYNPKTQSIDAGNLHGIGDDYTELKKRFRPVLYQWGVWVASWGRWEILKVVRELAAIGGKPRNGIQWNRKILYCDTDSVKWYKLGPEAFAVVEKYNQQKQRRLEEFCRRREINPQYLSGLGELDLETYTHFKALGLKQYAEIKIIDGKPEFDYHVAGLPRMDWVDKEDGTKRNRGCTYFDKWDDPEEKLEHFRADMVVPAEESHLKATHFIEEERCACITDQYGDCRHVSARSSILLVPKAFNLRQSFIERLRQTTPEQIRLAAARNFEGMI